MKNEEIVKRLRGMAVGVFRTCEGCKQENGCSIDGCVVLREAAATIERQERDIRDCIETVEGLREINKSAIEEWKKSYTLAFPGSEVWVIDRREDGTARDVGAYALLAVCAGYAMVSAYPVGARSIGEIMESHAKDTAESHVIFNIYVFPLKDCFVTQAEAEAAVRISSN
ncbi:MAG: hypothetical protein MSK39_03035 [Dysosmobacter sp.]|nr:hypothetical protein [Dysosmobacter sp.]